jgi:aminopeptidase N
MVRNISLFLLLISSVAWAQKSTCSEHKHQHVSTALQSSAMQTIGNNSRSDTFDITHYHIDLDLMEGAQQKITAATTVHFQSKLNNVNAIRLDLKALTVDSVKYNNQSIGFTHQNEVIDINFSQSFNQGDKDSLTVYYHGEPVVDASTFGGFDFQGSYWYNLGVAFVFEPHNFGRGWFPCFDNFVERSTYSYQIKTPMAFKSYANGNLLSETIQGNERIRYWKTTTEFPTYLAAVAAAPYVEIKDTFTSISGTEIPVLLTCLPNDSLKLVQSFEHLQNALDAFEDKFGAYRWEKVGYSATPVGAMEHPGNIAYPTNLINGNLSGEGIMAHELAHHWFGNLITCQTAQEMWINEGWAEYLSYFFEEAVYGKAKYKTIIRENHLNMLQSAHIQDNGYQILADMPLSVTYGRHTYNKGADVIHTLRTYMGDDLFFNAHKALMDSFAYSDISSEEFRDFLEAQGFTESPEFFNAYIFQKGWAQFDFGSWEITQNGNQFELQTDFVQNLREANNYYEKVPLEVDYYFADEIIRKKYIVSGNNHPSITETFNKKPLFGIINPDDNLSLASFAFNNIHQSTGTKSLNDIDVKYKVEALSDSARVIVQQNWVKPQGDYNTDAYIISPDRYYTFRTLKNSSDSIDIEFKYRGTTDGADDFELLTNITPNTYSEEQLMILYRENASQPWQQYGNQDNNTGSNMLNRSGKITVYNAKDGDYVLALYKYPISVDKNNPEGAWYIVPNPTSGKIFLQGKPQNIEKVSIFDNRGKKQLDIAKHKIHKEIDISHLPKGIYWFAISYTDGTTESQKILITQ